MTSFPHVRTSRGLVAATLIALAAVASGCDAPAAMGEADSLILIISDDLWEQSEDTAYAILEPTVHTTRNDKKFFVHRVAPDAPEVAELLLWKQVIVVGPPDDPRLTRIFETAGIAGVPEPGQVFQAEDVWARGQAATAVVLQPGFEYQSWIRLLPDLAATIDRDYRAYVLTRMYVSGPDTASARQLSESYGYTLEFPAVYEAAVLAEDVVLLRNDNPDPAELIRSIVIEVAPAADSLAAHDLVAWRETVARTHYNISQRTIADEGAGTPIELGGAPGLEVRGIWQDEGTYPAAGLFIARAVRCPEKTVLIDAWLYSPNPKRSKFEYIIQLEAILNSFRCEPES